MSSIVTSIGGWRFGRRHVAAQAMGRTAGEVSVEQAARMSPAWARVEVRNEHGAGDRLPVSGVAFRTL